MAKKMKPPNRVLRYLKLRDQVDELLRELHDEEKAGRLTEQEQRSWKSANSLVNNGQSQEPTSV